MRNVQYGTHRQPLAGLLKSLGTDGRTSVRLLNAEENTQVQSVSLDRFRHTDEGRIDWIIEPAIEQHTAENDAEAARLLSDILGRHVSNMSEVVVLWGNLAIPSIVLPAGSTANHIDEVIAVSYDLWLFASHERLVIEYFHDGSVTVAQVNSA